MLWLGMDVEMIREWIRVGEADLQRLNAEAERINVQVAQQRQQLTLMYELLATLTNETPDRSLLETGAGQPVRERTVQAALDILREHGKPLRIQDLHAEFIRRGVPLPGSGTPTNIASHLVDRTIFTRPGRGVFGLVEWGTPAEEDGGAAAAKHGRLTAASNRNASTRTARSTRSRKQEAS